MTIFFTALLTKMYCNFYKFIRFYIFTKFYSFLYLRSFIRSVFVIFKLVISPSILMVREAESRKYIIL